jgi:hypothetical protein
MMNELTSMKTPRGGIKLERETARKHPYTIEIPFEILKRVLGPFFDFFILYIIIFLPIHSHFVLKCRLRKEVTIRKQLLTEKR